MEDIFKPSSLTIKQLFGNTDALYQIPRYQRPYSWGDEQLEKLWEDLCEAFENEPNYFLGSIITAKSEESSTYLDIVDGQQRLTTLTIMLCVYRDLYPSINSEILDEDPFAIDNKIVESSIKFNDRFERLRLRTHSNHQSDFERIVLNGNTSQFKKPYKKDLRKDEPKYKFENTAHFFTSKLREIGETEAGTLLNYIFNKVKIIRIDCQSVSFAIKLFQVLNDRGLDLSNSDLIKSYLIAKIQKKYEANIELRKQKEDQFMDDWKVCEGVSDHTETPLNDLFVMFEYYLLAANPKKSLYDELVGQLDGRDPNVAMSEFKNFVSEYKNNIYDREDKLTYSFFYLRWGMYWRAILTTALHRNYTHYHDFAKLLRRFYYLNWLAGYTLTRIKQVSFNMIKWLKDGRTISEIAADLEFHLGQNQTIKRAQENVRGDIYFDQWCKPLLFLIEYSQTDETNLTFLSNWDRNLHVEHVVPRAYRQNSEWKKLFAGAEVEKRIDTGANLTLLSGEKNISASNDAFSKKIKAYSGKGFYSDNKDGITAFRMTQKIVDDYNAYKYNHEWNNQALDDRFDWFCKNVGNILGIDLGPEIIIES